MKLVLYIAFNISLNVIKHQLQLGHFGAVRLKYRSFFLTKIRVAVKFSELYIGYKYSSQLVATILWRFGFPRRSDLP